MLNRSIRVPAVLAALVLVGAPTLAAQGWKLVVTSWVVEAIADVTPEEIFAASEEALREMAESFETDTQTIWVDAKNKRFRTDADEGMYVVGDYGNSTVTMINQQEGWAVEITPESAKQMQQMFPGMPPGGYPGAAPQPSAADIDVRWVGSSTVNRMPCRIGEAKNGDDITRACITKEHPGLRDAYEAAMSMFEDIMPMMADQDLELENRIAEAGNGIPVLIQTVTREAMGLYEYSRESMEVIAQSVDASLFAIGDGIKMLTMQEFFQRMMGGMR